MVAVQRERIEPEDRAAWRRWLTEHGEASPGVWVVIPRTTSTRRRFTLDDATEEALCAGWVDSTLRRLDEQRSILLFTPCRPGSTWARSNKERVVRLTDQGLMTPAGRHVIEASHADGSWSLLDDVEALVVPPDLDAALAAEPPAPAGFDAWTPSRRKQYLWWVVSARRPTTRASRIAETVRLAAGGTGPDASHLGGSLPP
jgi:uncharacterized protein YdeI (YjbR/CyaY-like superfamily)